MLQKEYSINIDITCNSDSFQEINLLAIDTTSDKRVINNEILHCVDGYKHISYDSYNYLLFKLSSLVPNSPFKILIYQSNSVQRYKFSWILIVIFMLSIIVIVVLISFMLIKSENSSQNQSCQYDEVQIISQRFTN